MLPFPAGRYEGAGHWIDQKTEGDYTVTCVIATSSEGQSVHTVHRVFARPDGSKLYDEHTTVTFTPAERNGFRVTIRSAQGEVKGSGYYFDRRCHYNAEIAADNHLEWTYSIGSDTIENLASSTNKGNFTSWQETWKRA